LVDVANVKLARANGMASSWLKGVVAGGVLVILTGGAAAGPNDRRAEPSICSGGRNVQVNTAGLLSGESPTGKTVHPTMQTFLVGVDDDERAEAVVKALPELHPQKVGEVKARAWRKISAESCKELDLLEGEVRPVARLSGEDIFR
jgi:hypothetical protein